MRTFDHHIVILLWICYIAGYWNRSSPDQLYMYYYMRPILQLTCDLHHISSWRVSVSLTIVNIAFPTKGLYKVNKQLDYKCCGSMFVGKNGSFLESPKPCKICKNKLEASNLFLQGMWCDMVRVIKLLYEMIFIVNINNRQEPYGCLFPFMACVLNIYPCDIL